LFDNKCRVSRNFLHYYRPPKNASETSLIVPKKRLSLLFSPERALLSLSLSQAREPALAVCVLCLHCVSEERTEQRTENDDDESEPTKQRTESDNRRREGKAHRSGPLGYYPNLDTDGGNQFLTIWGWGGRGVGTAGREERDGGGGA
jgi:hypothetical protein